MYSIYMYEYQWTIVPLCTSDIFDWQVYATDSLLSNVLEKSCCCVCYTLFRQHPEKLIEIETEIYAKQLQNHGNKDV